MEMITRLAEMLRRTLARVAGDGVGALMMRGATGSFVVKIGGAALAFVVQAVLARALGVESFGRYIYALTWSNVGVLVGILGFNTAAVRYISQYRGSEEWGRLAGFRIYSRRVVMALSLLAAALLALVAFLLTSNRELFWTFVVAGATLPVAAFVKLQSAELRGLRKVVRAQAPELLFWRLLLIGALAVATLWLQITLNAPIAMGFYLVAGVVTIGLLAWLLRRHMPAEERSQPPQFERAEWLSTARDMLFIMGFSFILARADTLMVGATVGTTQAGMYAVASKVAHVLAFAPNAVNAILAPVAADYHAQGKKRALQRIVTRSTQVVVLIGIILCVGLGAGASYILAIFGEEFVAGQVALWILLAGQLVASVGGVALLLLNMTGHQRVSAKILAIGAILNLALNAALIPMLGAEGAAIATGATLALYSVAGVVAIRRNLGISVFPWKIL